MSGKSYRQAIDAADEAAVAAARRNEIYGTTGDDDLVGTAGGDSFFLYDGGDDRVRGLGGRDRFFFWETFDANDRVNGGDGDDRVILQGDYADLVIGPNMLRNVERLTLGEGGTYDITLKDGIGDLRIANAGSFGFDLDASAVTTGSLQVLGDNRDNTIRAGALDDRIVGGVGADVLTGGAGNDVFLYRNAGESIDNILGIDIITDFQRGDIIRLPDLSGGYHINSTPERTGDVLMSYDSAADRTALTVFTDGDSTADMVIYLSGQHVDLEVRHGVSLIGP